MPFLRNMLKTGIAMKAAQYARRELSKPENQRKLRELAHRVTSRQRRAHP